MSLKIGIGNYYVIRFKKVIIRRCHILKHAMFFSTLNLWKFLSAAFEQEANLFHKQSLAFVVNI